MITERNVWQDLADAELVGAMRLCGCDAKFIDGGASDFECFCELLRIFDKLEGHKVTERVLSTLVKSCGRQLDESHMHIENAKAFWRKNGEELTEKQLSKCDEKYNISTNLIILRELDKKACDYKEFISKLKKDIQKSNACVLAVFEREKFESPNPYLAGKEFEKCQKIQSDILQSQIICEILSDKKYEKIQVYIDFNGNLQSASKYVSYLSKHNMSARVYIVIHESDDEREILNACSASDEKCFVTPCILLLKNQTIEDYETLLSRLKKIYPLGMLSVLEI